MSLDFRRYRLPPRLCFYSSAFLNLIDFVQYPGQKRVLKNFVLGSGRSGNLCVLAFEFNVALNFGVYP